MMVKVRVITEDKTSFEKSFARVPAVQEHVLFGGKLYEVVEVCLHSIVSPEWLRRPGATVATVFVNNQTDRLFMEKDQSTEPSDKDSK